MQYRREHAASRFNNREVTAAADEELSPVTVARESMPRLMSNWLREAVFGAAEREKAAKPEPTICLFADSRGQVSDPHDNSSCLLSRQLSGGQP